MSMLPHSLCLAQAPLAGEKNKQPHITPQGLDTKHPQSNLPISLTKTFEQVTWISHTSPPPSTAIMCSYSAVMNRLFKPRQSKKNTGSQEAAEELHFFSSLNHFMSFSFYNSSSSWSSSLHLLHFWTSSSGAVCSLFFPPVLSFLSSLTVSPFLSLSWDFVLLARIMPRILKGLSCSQHTSAIKLGFLSYTTI